MKLIKFILIILCYYVTTIQANPLEWTTFTILSPTIFTYAHGDTIFALSKEGLLFPITRVKNEGQFVYEKQDSLLLGIENIEWGGWDGRFLYLSTPEGFFRWSKSQGLHLIRRKRTFFIENYHYKTVAVLFPKKIVLLNQGKQIAEFQVPKTTYYVQIFNDSLLGVWAKNQFQIRTISGKIKRVFKFYNWNSHILWKKYRDKFVTFYPRLGTCQGDTIAFSPGYQRFGDKFTEVKSLLAFYRISQNDTIGTTSIMGQVIRMWSTRPFKMCVSAPYVYILGNIYLFDNEIFHPRNINLETDVDAFPFYRDFILSFSFATGYSIFSFNHPETRYQNSLANPYSYALPFFYKDINKDGIEDLVLLGSSIWQNKEDRVYEVSILINRIPSELQNIYSWIQRARRLNNFFECEKALFLVEKALTVANYLLPDSTQKYLKLREEINTKVRQKRLVENALAQVSGYIPGVLALTLIIVLFVRLRRKMDENRSIPSAETLNFMQGEALFHKLATTMQDLLKGIEQNESRIIESAQSEVESFRKYLSQKKVRYEFISAPKRWRRFYRKLVLQLVFITMIIWFYRWSPNITPRRKIILNQLQHRIKQLLKLKSEFKELIENAKLDVISSALLLAVNDVQQKHHENHIVFRTQVQVEFPYRYFPDEIIKFRKAFLAILENAVEAFENMGQCPPRLNQILVRAQSSMDELTITIKDNARGMHPEIVEKIFTPGFSYGKSKKERGYGLSGVKEFFSEYGEISVRSTFCEGTEFTIKLIFGKLPKGA